MTLGRNWYQVTWFSPEDGIYSEERLWADIPTTIDVLAKSRQQCWDIVNAVYPMLEHCDFMFINLAGTERQFQAEQEPVGEEDLELLPF